ncbi:UDP-N-acetylmuramoyl-L-alanine--D-glutamate ligase [Ligilactobacillus ceti]|nr:UDP-N-acetylmuramoyl-L-alanine--D-glutamate ligase [Ligilactobacillus ceti]
MKNITTYQNKNVLVLGLGKSGLAAADLLNKLGANVTINDFKVPEDLSIVHQLEEQGMKVVLGSHPLELLEQCELMVKNPGIPYTNPLVAAAQKQGLTIITEPELAFMVSKAPVIAVTGTNGKTTTTTLITAMLNQNRSQGHAYAVGNIGVPASEIAQKATADDVLVFEMSSFQLMGIQTFRPKIAVLTNLYEAHTDYHGSRDNYVAAKQRILMNQTDEDYFVANFDQAEVRAIAENSAAEVVSFSRKDTADAMVKDGAIYYKNEKIIAVAELRLPGLHNLENALAATSVAKLMGVATADIVEVLSTFTGVRHRTQYVTTIAGRKFYNDSKATNMEATKQALTGFSKNVILLAGGLDRGFTFDALVPDLKNKVKALVVFGETADLLAQAGETAQVADIIYTKDAQTAVKAAYQLSQPEDVILLSPACASWDQWKNFEIRGDKYIEAIEELKTEVEEV